MTDFENLILTKAKRLRSNKKINENYITRESEFKRLIEETSYFYHLVYQSKYFQVHVETKLELFRLETIWSNILINQDFIDELKILKEIFLD